MSALSMTALMEPPSVRICIQMLEYPAHQVDAAHRRANGYEPAVKLGADEAIVGCGDNAGNDPWPRTWMPVGDMKGRKLSCVVPSIRTRSPGVRWAAALLDMDSQRRPAEEGALVVAILDHGRWEREGAGGQPERC